MKLKGLNQEEDEEEYFSLILNGLNQDGEDDGDEEALGFGRKGLSHDEADG